MPSKEHIDKLKKMDKRREKMIVNCIEKFHTLPGVGDEWFFNCLRTIKKEVGSDVTIGEIQRALMIIAIVHEAKEKTCTKVKTDQFK